MWITHLKQVLKFSLKKTSSVSATTILAFQSKGPWDSALLLGHRLQSQTGPSRGRSSFLKHLV